MLLPLIGEGKKSEVAVNSALFTGNVNAIGGPSGAANGTKFSAVYIDAIVLC